MPLLDLIERAFVALTALPLIVRFPESRRNSNDRGPRNFGAAISERTVTTLFFSTRSI